MDGGPGSYIADLESRPDHALRPGHATDLRPRLRPRMLRDRQRGRLGRALRASHRVRQTARTGVAELLDGPPLAEAEVTGLADDAVGVVAGVLVKGNGVGEVRAADDVAAVAAVVFAEVPGEGCLADCAGKGGFVGLSAKVVSSRSGT